MPNPGRKTRQREAILAAAMSLAGHPTAQEIHAQVRTVLPRVSLGTVYRNLEIFVRDGLLARIPVDGGQARFDANSRPHWHIQCVHCGRVKDVRDPPLAREALSHMRIGGFAVLDVHCQWLGLCAQCRQEEKLRIAGGREGR
ncbi:MAG: transcriptional repressor [Candidatus Eisenbacteria sp.]|nr:transcriptional repressor [Candidatus Eisenbacteria bacterium]